MTQKQKPTVFQIVQHLRPGGLEVMALSLLQAMTGRAHVKIIALDGTKDDALTHWPLLNSHADDLIFLDKKPGWSARTLFHLARLFQRHSPDVVHTHHIGPLLYGGLAARLTRTPALIHTEHDGWHLHKNAKIQKRLLRGLKPTLIPVAQQVAQCLTESCGVRADRVIPNGIDSTAFTPGHKTAARQQLGLPLDRVLIGTAGRLEAVKGQRFLIEAMSALPDHVHLVLAGDGTEAAELRQRTKARSLSHRVHFMGRVDRMPLFYQALDLFCLPSLHEGFPLSPLEAQACGLPCVLSDVGGAAETLCPAQGRLARAGDVQDLAACLRDLLSQDHTTAPRDFVLRRFTRDQMRDAYSALYDMNTAQMA